MQTKSLLTIVFTASFAFMLFSCFGNHNDTTNDDPYVAPENPDTIAKLPELKMDGDRDVNGRNYSYSYKMTPNDTLPVVTSFTGQRYYDNEVLLTVSGNEGEILRKTFTKKSFSDFFPSAKMKEMSLVGFNYYMAKDEDHSNLFFIAMISDPEDNDENLYAIEIRVSPAGEVQMSKADLTVFETGPSDYADEV